MSLVSGLQAGSTQFPNADEGPPGVPQGPVGACLPPLPSQGRAGFSLTLLGTGYGRTLPLPRPGRRLEGGRAWTVVRWGARGRSAVERWAMWPPRPEGWRCRPRPSTRVTQASSLPSSSGPTWTHVLVLVTVSVPLAPVSLSVCLSLFWPALGLSLTSLALPPRSPLPRLLFHFFFPLQPHFPPSLPPFFLSLPPLPFSPLSLPSLPYPLSFLSILRCNSGSQQGWRAGWSRGLQMSGQCQTGPQGDPWAIAALSPEFLRAWLGQLSDLRGSRACCSQRAGSWPPCAPRAPIGQGPQDVRWAISPLSSSPSPTRWPQDRVVGGGSRGAGRRNPCHSFFWRGVGRKQVVDSDLHKITRLRPEPEHM